jgi:hypothetical protein
MLRARSAVSLLLLASVMVAGCSSGSNSKESQSLTPTLVEETAPAIIYAEEGSLEYFDTSHTIPDQKALQDAKIQFPGGQVSILAVGPLESIPMSTENLPQDTNWKSDTVSVPDIQSPAEGEKFFAFRMKSDYYDTDIQASPSYALNVDGKTQELSGLTAAEMVIVKSVPENVENISLEVRFDGLVQTMDLQDGTRDESTLGAAFYTGSDFAHLPNGGIVSGEAPGPVGIVSVTATVLEGHRTPWLGDKGWALQGEGAWLTINLSSPSWAYDSDTITSVESPDHVWTLTDSDGTVYPLHASSDVSTLMFEVPARITDFTLSFKGQAQTWVGIDRGAIVEVVGNSTLLEF